MSASVSTKTRPGEIFFGFGAVGSIFCAKLLFFVAYVMSIVMAYRGNGLFWACVTAIPFFGQMLWFGVMWSAAGIFNVYACLIYSGGAFYALAALMAFLLERGGESPVSVVPQDTTATTKTP